MAVLAEGELADLVKQLLQLKRERDDERTGRLHNLHEVESLREQCRELAAHRVRLTRERDDEKELAASMVSVAAEASRTIDTLRTRAETAEGERDDARRALCEEQFYGDRCAPEWTSPRDVAVGRGWGYLYPEETSE